MSGIRSYYICNMPNRLSAEQSTYLLQHAHNPVDWYPWGEEAFFRAGKEQKPVLVSIGYSACHWCHVMERESFENEEVAAFMNANFICVKVDREEHPEVDHLYMDAVTAISGSGGWPLNVFVTPEKEPFYGGTYFPPQPAYHRPSWIQVLARMAEIWQDQKDEVHRQARQLTDHIRQATEFAASANLKVCTSEVCAEIAADMLKRADLAKGGFGSAPKFPFSMAISFLLAHYRIYGNKDALGHALRSLDAMADGGIYDQLGGGFARYSTDSNWLAPHFEKMLYDNALLLQSYCEAYRITRDEKYKQVVTETIHFINQELKSVEGGFFAAIDADSESVEGKFYTWSYDEFCTVAGADKDVLAACLGVIPGGNWEHTNILHRPTDIDSVAVRFGWDTVELTERLDQVKKNLLTERNKRIRPVTDDKCLLSWNAWMNAGLVSAATALSSDIYLAEAESHCRWMVETYFSGGAWYRSWKGGKVRIPATLDDLAALVYAMLSLSAATGDVAYLRQAASLTETIISRFLDPDQGWFYFTAADQTDIPVRKIELHDGATPSSNAVMAYNLMVLGICYGNNYWIRLADGMVAKMVSQVSQYSISYGFWAGVMQRFSRGLKVVVCLGAGSDSIRREWQSGGADNTYLVTSRKEIFDIPLLEKKYFDNKNHIFVCSQEACQMPVETVAAALKLAGA